MANNQPTSKIEALSNQELFDLVLAKIKENLDQDVAENTKTKDQANFILREQKTYLKTYLKI